MAKNQESINRSLFELLRSRGYAPTLLDTSGKEIPVPEEAEVFQFKFTKDGEEYGTVTASIDGLHKLVIYFGDDVANSAKGEGTDDDWFDFIKKVKKFKKSKLKESSGDDSWYKLLNHLKRFAQKHQLSFEVKNRDHLKYDMAKREHMKKQERISEGYHPMGKKASYNDNIPTVKIVIEHTRQIEEGEQRYRNVNRIFLENTQGERILAPTTKPGVAQVYARHLAEGGMPHDDRWNHIISLCEEYNKMGAFVRATRHNQFNESAQQLVNEGINHYQSLRESLSKMRGARGYNSYFESYTPPLMEDESEENNLNELFVQETLDPRIESVMPILNKLHKKVAEMKEVNELSEWADNLIESGLDEGDEEIDEAMFPASKIGDKLRDIKTGANDLGAGSALKVAGIASPALGAAATGAATAGLSGALPSTIPGMANLSIAGAEGALIYLPVIGAGALGATAAALGGFLTYKGLNWLAQKLFGTKEEAIEFAKLHLAAAEAGKPNFEFQGKSYPVKIKNKEDASDLMMRVYELETQLKESLTEEDDLDEGMMDTVKKVGSKVFDKLGGGSEEDLIRDLQKSAGVTPTGKKPEFDVKAKELARSNPSDPAGNFMKGGKDLGIFKEEGLDPAQQADQKINTPAVQRKEKGGDWKVTKQDLDKADEKNMTSTAGMAALKKKMSTMEENQLDEIGDTPAGREKLEKYINKADLQLSQHWADTHDKGHLPTDQKMAKRNSGTLAANKRLSTHSNTEKELAENEFAGDYATGEAGQWRNKGPKAHKPATIGDLVGEGQEDLDAIKRLLNK